MGRAAGPPLAECSTHGESWAPRRRLPGRGTTMLVPLLLLLPSAAPASSASPARCNATTDTTCPTAAACCESSFSVGGWGCSVNVPALVNASAGCGDGLGARPSVCCKSGPGDEPSAKLPNVLVIGDSVSICYTTGQDGSPVYVQELLKDVAQVQHGPWDVSDGGAGDTAAGVACLDTWLRTQRQTVVKWDLILFNFGLHDMTNTSHCEALYRSQLTNITARLAALGTKLIYVTTTPFMPLRQQGNMVVEDMNKIARSVVGAHKIPVRLPAQRRPHTHDDFALKLWSLALLITARHNCCCFGCSLLIL